MAYIQTGTSQQSFEVILVQSADTVVGETEAGCLEGKVTGYRG